MSSKALHFPQSVLSVPQQAEGKALVLLVPKPASAFSNYMRCQGKASSCTITLTSSEGYVHSCSSFCPA